MTEMIELALTYGGYTSLDKVFLSNQLQNLSKEEQLAFITPPPSVINAYFAELYQKQGPTAATDYFAQISEAFNLWNSQPSFDETKPFIRLNLSGKSYGLCFESANQTALVFPEEDSQPSLDLLFELAQIFPQYKVYREQGQIKMAAQEFDETVLEDLTPESALLSQISRLKAGFIKIKSFNADELAELLQAYKGQCYVTFQQREYIAYIKEQN
ncbi:cystathionine beta-lyase [Streptococcus loxodontisalivarius]|uniref:Cystathionine beta-lyase n=1 Tax=Streptococcus loxodontisalivarius TaxID=1349415 RepID=A0ABS2PRT9_9STRE|nr:cystathionine beta-lyase [Streptococcus loxodontisalivarius]MBM7642641.1 hypothetical protein [Streptococcus loxodontisalivarius]